MNKLYLGLLFSFLATFVSAQTLLDPVTHPKFQNPLPSPAKINVGAATTTMQMAQTTQWLGLVDPNNAPLQTTVWGYGLSTGAVSYPGPTLVANSNSVANIEWRNNLPQTHLIPLDSTYHRAVATNGIPTVVHVHGAHVEAASDGNTEAWYTSGYAQKGPKWTKSLYTYGNTQEGATLWYHDHALGMTRLNVYAGLAGFYLLNDANDQAVNLPRGAYDREIVIQDRMFDNTGQLFLPTDPAVTNGGLPEFFGDFIVVNGVVWPYMNVEPRKYRLRLLNGSDSRAYIFGFSNGASFFQIGTDDGKLNSPVPMTQLTMMPGERAEVIVDFSAMNGQTVTLLNTGTDEPFGNPASAQADPLTTGQIMQFRVNQPLNAAIPDVTLTAATNLRPTLGAIADVGTPAKTRKLGLFEGTDDLGRIFPLLGIVDPTSPLDGSLSWHDPVTENVNLNDIETWEIYNTTADAHPVHLHLVKFQILSKQTFTGTLTDKTQVLHNGGIGMGATLSNIVLTGTPQTFTPAQSGWKDTHILMPGEVMKIKAKFDLAGEYVWHCHILSHEDHDMMRQLVVLPTINPCSPDVTQPVMTACPANQSLTTTGTTAVATWTAPTATDACSTPIVSFSTSPTVGLTNGGVFPIGTTTVSYMAMDGANNMAMCSFTVTVTSTNACATDAVAPVLTACPTNRNLTTTGTSAVASWTAPTATDACSTPSVTFATSPTTGLTNGGAFPVGTTTVTYTATDAKNNTATCRFNVVVANTNPCTNDLTPPAMTACPANQNLTTTGTTAVASWTAPTATDACSTPSVTFTTMPTTGLTNGGAFPIGTTMVTYMAMDAKNNMSTCSFNIAVTNPCTNDVTPPTLTACPTNKNLTTTGTTAVASWTAPTATDNCGAAMVSFTTSPTAGLTNGGAFPVGTTTVTYMAMDVKNNMSTCSFNVIVTNTNTCTNDITPPVINNCPATQNLTTTGTTAVASWVSPTATDNCSTPTLTFTTSPTAALTNGGAFPVGTTTVTYMAMDANNNMTTCRFDIVVGQTNACATDAIAPVMTACPANINLTTTGTTAVATWTAPTATDNCGTPSVTFTTMPTTGLTKGGAFPVGTTMVTYMAMDAKNNMSMCNFNVVVTNTNPCATDVTKPVLTACPTNKSLTTTGTTAIATWTAPTATDNCSTPTVTFATSPTVGLTKGGAFPSGTTTGKYTAKDAKLNTSTCSFTVTVSNLCATDVTKPVLTACPTNLNLTTTGTTAVANWTAPTATDNCSTPTVTFATSPTVGLLKGGAFPIGTTKVTYTAKDAKLNTATCSFTVTVSNPCATDVTKPVLTACPTNKSLTTIGTTAIATWTAPTATDNCSTPSVSFATAPTLGLFSGALFPIGTTTVTYTAKDAKLNTSTCSFTVNVTNPCATDVTKPVISGCPANQTLTTSYGFAVSTTWTAPTATDNCTLLSLTSNYVPGSYFNVGTTTVVYTAKDAKLNTSTCSFNVIVNTNTACTNDVTPPVITNCPTNQSLTTSGTSTTTTWAAPTATDNCSASSLTSNYASGSYFNLGTTTVVYTAKDAKLNTATCSFNVTVSQPPSLSSPIDENLCHILSSGAMDYAYVQPDLNYATNQPILDVDMQILLNTGVFGWVFKNNGDGTYRLSFKGKVATVSNASMSNMASIVMSDWTGADNQRWIVTITPYPIGGLTTYKFKAKHSGLVMTRAAASQYVQSPDIAGYTLSQLFISNASYCDLTIYGSNQSVLTMDAKADVNQTRLEWVNNTGVKNKDFTVERLNPSTKEFEAIAVVQNNSKDISTTYYSAYDKTPLDGDNIYRIKLSFLDGSTKISNIKIVNFKDLNAVRVFPNPANDMINIDLPSYKGQNVDVYLFNSLGQQKLFNNVEKLDNTRIELDATNLPVGNYMIRVTSKDKRDVVKPVVIAH